MYRIKSSRESSRDRSIEGSPVRRQPPSRRPSPSSPPTSRQLAQHLLRNRQSAASFETTSNSIMTEGDINPFSLERYRPVLKTEDNGPPLTPVEEAGNESSLYSTKTNEEESHSVGMAAPMYEGVTEEEMRAVGYQDQHSYADDTTFEDSLVQGMSTPGRQFLRTDNDMEHQSDLPLNQKLYWESRDRPLPTPPAKAITRVMDEEQLLVQPLRLRKPSRTSNLRGMAGYEVPFDKQKTLMNANELHGSRLRTDDKSSINSFSDLRKLPPPTRAPPPPPSASIPARHPGRLKRSNMEADLVAMSSPKEETASFEQIQESVITPLKSREHISDLAEGRVGRADGFAQVKVIAEVNAARTDNVVPVLQQLSQTYDIGRREKTKQERSDHSAVVKKMSGRSFENMEIHTPESKPKYSFDSVPKRSLENTMRFPAFEDAPAVGYAAPLPRPVVSRTGLRSVTSDKVLMSASVPYSRTFGIRDNRTEFEIDIPSRVRPMRNLTFAGPAVPYNIGDGSKSGAQSRKHSGAKDENQTRTRTGSRAFRTREILESMNRNDSQYPDFKIPYAEQIPRNHAHSSFENDECDSNLARPDIDLSRAPQDLSKKPFGTGIRQPSQPYIYHKRSRHQIKPLPSMVPLRHEKSQPWMRDEVPHPNFEQHGGHDFYTTLPPPVPNNPRTEADSPYGNINTGRSDEGKGLVLPRQRARDAVAHGRPRLTSKDNIPLEQEIDSSLDTVAKQPTRSVIHRGVAIPSGTTLVDSGIYAYDDPFEAAGKKITKVASDDPGFVAFRRKLFQPNEQDASASAGSGGHPNIGNAIPPFQQNTSRIDTGSHYPSSTGPIKGTTEIKQGNPIQLEIDGNGLSQLSQTAVQAEKGCAEVKTYADTMPKVVLIAKVPVFLATLTDLRVVLCTLNTQVANGSTNEWHLFKGHDRHRIETTYLHMCTQFINLSYALGNLATEHGGRTRIRAIRGEMISILEAVVGDLDSLASAMEPFVLPEEGFHPKQKIYRDENGLLSGPQLHAITRMRACLNDWKSVPENRSLSGRVFSGRKESKDNA